jgi:putative membrane protein
MGAKFLDDAARRAFKQAIETIENASAVEVVVAMRQRSGRYLHANVIAGVAVAIAGLAAMLFSAHEFALTSILVDPFVVGLIAAIVVEQVPPLVRVLTPRSWRQREVLRAARATFVERGVHHTTGRTGVLVYISWLEHEIALVPDGGIHVPLATAQADLTAAMSRGGAAVAARLEALAPEFAADLPHQDDDINELPDAIDEGP